MLTRYFLAMMATMVVGISTAAPRAGRHRRRQAALTGQVTSAEEGAMEGVVVSAKRQAPTSRSA